MGPLAGFTGVVHELERRWRSTPDEEIRAIVGRAWPAMRDLDEATFDEATGPAIRALEALPRRRYLRCATAEMIVLKKV